jgi:ketosteroid isomerase-like protein
MGAEENIKTVQRIYEAFGQGDVETMLDQLTDDIDFAVEPNGSAPWNGVRHGKAEVAEFFAALGGSVEVTDFTPLAITSNDDDVMVVVRYAVTARSTGKSVAFDLHHWWRFRGDKVCFVRGTEDTAATNDMLRAG